MKNKDSVELIEYTKAQDALNCATHALGAIFGAAVLVLLIKNPALGQCEIYGSGRRLRTFDYFALRLVGGLPRSAAGRGEADGASCRSSGYPRAARGHGDPVLTHNAL